MRTGQGLTSEESPHHRQPVHTCGGTREEDLSPGQCRSILSFTRRREGRALHGGEQPLPSVLCMLFVQQKGSHTRPSTYLRYFFSEFCYLSQYSDNNSQSWTSPFFGHGCATKDHTGPSRVMGRVTRPGGKYQVRFILFSSPLL